ncbi:MAG TPA: hypothetical protein VHL10_00870 [Nitrososphaera sp.]|jgi:hypothetical protein|nr:hypothetical protein [Nitrososphaera sp.]
MSDSEKQAILQIAQEALERGQTGRVVDRMTILENGLRTIIDLCKKDEASNG